MKKVLLLTRVSSTDQNHDRQVTELTEYAANKGYQVVEVIKETISGAKQNSERESIQKLLYLGASKKINKVLVHEVTRLGRDTSEILNTLKELHSYGVSVVVMNYNIETLNPGGGLNHMAQFLITILADIGRMERATLVERVKSGMAEAKRQGKHVGRPEGTTKDKDDMLKEYKEVVKCLQLPLSVRKTADACKVGVSTVQRVKKLMGESKTTA